MTEMFAPLRFGTQLVETPQDWQHFESLLRAYATTDLDQPHLSSIWNDLEALPARYGPPHGAAILLSTTEQRHHYKQVIGCGAIASTHLSGACEIKRLYIKPDLRGKGGSKVLIRQLLQLAQTGGYDQAVLSTWQHNTTGLALYKALGFVPVPSFKSHPNSELIFLGRMLSAADAQTSP